MAASAMPSSAKERGPTAPWFQVMARALTRPTEGAYRVLASDPGARFFRSLTWVFVSSLLATIAFALVQIASGSNMTQTIRLLGWDPGQEGERASSVYLLFVCLMPFLAILATLAITAYSSLVHLTARALGGQGTFIPLLHVFAAISAPVTLAISVVGLVPIANLLSLPLGLYALFLQILAVKTVHQLAWPRAAVSTLLLVVAFFLLFRVSLVGIL
jgi:hypothetical protein